MIQLGVAPESIIESIKNLLKRLLNKSYNHYYDQNVHYQWHIQRFFGNTVFSRGFQGRSPKGHNCELWRMISVINMYGWHGQSLFTMWNVTIVYLVIVLDIVLGESSFKITLTCSTPLISESCIKIKINLNFYFHTLRPLRSLEDL